LREIFEETGQSGKIVKKLTPWNWKSGDIVG